MKIQDKITEFSRKTFPNSTAMSKYKHLEKELEELFYAIVYSEPHELGADSIAEEIADCMILLFDIAGFYSIDALKEVNKKHKINLTRKWGKPDERGVVEHIRELENG